MELKSLFKQSSEERIHKITNDNIKKTFLIIALPNIITVMIRAITPILDGLIIYNFDDEVGGAAISYANSLSNILIMGIFALGVGGSAIIGKCNGSGDKDKALKLTGQLMSLILLFGILVIPILLVTANILTHDFSDAVLKSKVMQYIALTAFSIPFFTVQTVYTSVKSVFGHPEAALFRTLLFVPLKLLFSFIFIIVLNLGVVGAGLSSLTAYIVVFLFIAYEMFIKDTDEKIKLKHLKLEKKTAFDITKKSWPLVVQDSLKSLSFFLIRFEVAKYGTIALSASGIASDVNMVFAIFITCFTSAIIAFVSVNVGAEKFDRAQYASKFGVKLALSIAIVGIVISNLFTPQIVGWYTDNPVISEQAIIAVRLYASGYIGFALMFSEAPTFNALGYNKTSMFIQLLRIWVIRLFFLYLLYYLFEDIGFIAVYISLSIANNLGGLLSHIFYKKINWKHIKK